jgi:hypothetical protein
MTGKFNSKSIEAITFYICFRVCQVTAAFTIV